MYKGFAADDDGDVMLPFAIQFQESGVLGLGMENGRCQIDYRGALCNHK